MAADVGVREQQPRIVGRYALFDEIAAGGMATVHLGRLVGPVGFGRTVAIKTLHPQFAKDPEFVEMFLEEARLASRVVHPNVVRTEDIATEDGEVFLVMEYVAGESLARLIRAAFKTGSALDAALTTSIISQTLRGLHIAHEATNEEREPLQLVHRDVSPQNILVGLDGVARIFDFGVAKAAAARSQATTDGQMKGKLSYMSPEQLNGKRVDRRTDVFAAGVVAWECLAGRRLFAGSDPGEVLAKVLRLEIPALVEIVPELPPELSEVIMRALERDPAQRWDTAQQFALGLEQAVRPAAADVLSEWVMEHAQEALSLRERQVQRVERASILLSRPPSYPTAAPPSPTAPAPAKPEQPQPPSLGSMARMAVSGTATRNVAGAEETDLEGSGVARSPTYPERDGGGTRKAVWLTLGLTLVTCLALFWWLFGEGGFPEGAPSGALPTADLYAVPNQGADNITKPGNAAAAKPDPPARAEKKARGPTAQADAPEVAASKADAPEVAASKAAASKTAASKAAASKAAASKAAASKAAASKAAASKRAKPAAAAAKKRRKRSTARRRRKAAPVTPPQPDPCEEPKQLGSDGIWRIKPQCM